VKTGHQDVIVPFPQTSTNAARFFSHWGEVEFDMAFIDGSHEEEDVADDLDGYEVLLSDRGFMCGDDYCEYWDGVRKAVDNFAEYSSYELKTEHYDNGQGVPPSDYWILTP
jgi:hypothetical protein